MADTETQPNLEKAIFGDDSDLSSDEGSDNYQRSGRKRGKSVPEDDSSVDSDEEDAARRSKPRKRKAKAGDADGPPKKRKKKKATPPPEAPLGPAEERRQRLDQSIKEILKPAKRAKKRSKKNEEELDEAADNYIKSLGVRMLDAANKDKQLYLENQPAPYKLAMLDEVMDAMQKRHYASSIMDQGLLQSCKVWLEPLDAKSLPILNIQRSFFEQFTKMTIDTDALRESGLGRIVLFYTKCKRVTQPIQRLAAQLVEEWSRPILKRSASYRDKYVPTATHEDMETTRVQMPKLSAILNKAREEQDPSRVRKQGASVPERTLTTYTVAPRFSQSFLERNPMDDALAVRRSNKELLKRLQKKEGGKGGK